LRIAISNRSPIDICDEALPRWQRVRGLAELDAKRAQLLGRLERRRARRSDEFEDDGNPIPACRHHSETPRHSRPRRFTLDRPQA
jgi:hypothetical protein